MFETIKTVVTSREFLIGAGTGVTLGVITGYFSGRRRAVKELEAKTEQIKDAAKEFVDDLKKSTEETASQTAHA